MTKPLPAPLTPSDWRGWPAPSDGAAWPTASVADDLVVWRNEGIVALLVAAYSILLGGVVGLIWPRVAPHVDLTRAVQGSEASTKALLGDDMWFLLLGVTAGVLCVALAMVMSRDAMSGPGASVGLVVGGLLGSIVAAHVGHLVQEPHVVRSLHTAFPKLPASSTKAILGYFGFTVRMRGVLLAWPMTAVVLHAVVVGLRGTRTEVRAAD